ncbi:hypothetical protein DB30_06985 [Enhygromyxa salina]|uniref:Uncharacterized protein n=1 Tax=Enhygromyxa salina TaxID=215803 RepID=A0A0C2CSU7_9BACT|nr:hypothetical protein DB30_06985 [Enhygromyxa salina]
MRRSIERHAADSSKDPAVYDPHMDGRLRRLQRLARLVASLP